MNTNKFGFLRESIESIFTRGISILTKFILIGILVKELSLPDYGNYQLVSYFVLLSTTIFGFEYYNITNRTIVSLKNKSIIYSHHFSLFFTLLSILLLIQGITFYMVLPSELTSFKIYFIVLTICLCDYLSQEVYRYLMINKQFRKANLLLIYKSFFLLTFVLTFKYVFRYLDFFTIIILMLLAHLMLLVFALVIFNNTLLNLDRIRFKKLSYRRIKKIFIKLTPFLTLIIFVKGIEFSDKFIIGKTLGSKDAGIYSFLYTIGSIINIFVVSGFYLIYLPELIQKFNFNKKGFKKLMIKFSKLNIGFSLLMVFLIKITEEFLIHLTGKLELLEYTNMLTYILIGFVFWNTSLIPHIFLYISNNEKVLMYITGLAFIVNVSSTFYLINLYGVFGVALSFVITYFFMLLCKSYISYRIWKRVI